MGLNGEGCHGGAPDAHFLLGGAHAVDVDAGVIVLLEGLGDDVGAHAVVEGLGHEAVTQFLEPGVHGDPVSPLHLFLHLVAGHAEVYEKLLHLRGLGGCLRCEGGVGGDNACEYLALPGVDLHGVACDGAGHPATHRGDGSETLVVHVVDQEANLVDVAGEHHPGSVLTLSALLQGYDVLHGICSYLVCVILQLLPEEFNHGVFPAGDAVRFAKSFQEFHIPLSWSQGVLIWKPAPSMYSVPALPAKGMSVSRACAACSGVSPFSRMRFR